jgi:hypothetical protein
MRVLLHVAIAAVMIPLIVAASDLRAGSLRSTYHRAVENALRRDMPAPVVAESDLADMPPVVQRWLRRAGVVGKPRVRSLHAEFTAEMRSGRDEAWMKSRADQYEFFSPNERLFFMKAHLYGIPFHVLHHYAGDSASMRVRVLGLIPVSTVRGAEMTKSETVTLLNDMCVFAPGALIGAPVTWTVLTERTVQATFTNAGYRVAAILTFDESGDLANFRSDDRSRADGTTMRRLPWTTPLSDYRAFGGVRLAARGDAQWTDSSGTWAYGRFTLQRIEYNVTKVWW